MRCRHLPPSPKSSMVSMKEWPGNIEGRNPVGLAGGAYRVTLSRLVPGFSVRTWEIQQEKSHKNEKVTAPTGIPGITLGSELAKCLDSEDSGCHCGAGCDAAARVGAAGRASVG
eukprot:SAG31_NODE_59_length_29571_cov_20.443506_1_plen_113_part_10